MPATTHTHTGRGMPPPTATAPNAIPLAAAPRPPRGIFLRVLAGALLLAIVVVAAYGTGYGYRPVREDAPAAVADVPAEPKALQQQERKLRGQQRQLLAALARKSPRGVYIVIDQTQNRLYLMQDEKVLREAVCSAGSGMVLQEQQGGKRRWVFDSPRGVHRVRSKIEAPMWIKPDWAFVEEGKPIPKDRSERFAPGELGEYALYFGNGYMIHGTLYERLLGRSVSHGCIRVGRDDLREVWKLAPIGTNVYIY